MSPTVIASPDSGTRGFVQARAFGADRGDLDFDFTATERFALAARIVAACTATGADRTALEQAILELPVGTRIARLLCVVAATERADVLTVPLTCFATRCGERFEVHLPYARLVDNAATEANPWVEVVLARGTGLRMRCPTGLDQRAWRTETFATSQDAILGMVEALATSSSGSVAFDDRDIETLAGAMEEVDPLTAFRVVTTCPSCGTEATFEIDLEAEALRRLAGAQRALLHDVHLLASHYGWTEAEVAAVPPSRRAHYVRMIESRETVSTP